MTQQALVLQSMIGTKVVLWKFKYSNEAYTDHFGRSHDGWVVYEEIVITITEEQAEQSTAENRNKQTWTAVAEDGREFHTDSPSHRWYLPVFDKEFHYADVRQLYSPHQIFATPEGEPARPLAAEVCDQHHSAFMPGEKLTNKGCHECYMNFKYPLS
jgi:hypothetical protein